jgi:hypothetical protein
MLAVAGARSGRPSCGARWHSTRTSSRGRHDRLRHWHLDQRTSAHAAWQLLSTSNEFVIIIMLSRPVIVLLGGDEAFDDSV